MAEVSLWASELRAGTLPSICIKSGQPADAKFTFEFVTLESPRWTFVAHFVRASLLPSRIGPVRAALPVTRRWFWTFAIPYWLRMLGPAVYTPCLVVLWFVPGAPRLALASAALIGSLTVIVASLLFNQ